MFADHESDSDEERYEDYDGYRGSSELRKIKKKAKIIKDAKKNNGEESDDEMPADADLNAADDDIDLDEEIKGSIKGKTKGSTKKDSDDIEDIEADEDDEYLASTYFNPYATYRKEYKIIDPADNMTSDKLSRYDYAHLITIETARIEREGYTFIPTEGLDTADTIAEATINARKSCYMVRRKVGFEIDHKRKVIIEIYEDHDPNLMFSTKLNASSLI